MDGLGEQLNAIRNVERRPRTDFPSTFITQSTHRTSRSLLHPVIPSLTFDPPPYPSEPCLTLSKSRGPTTPMLQRSHTFCTFKRRPTLPEYSSPRFSTVRKRRPHLQVRPPVLTALVQFITGITIVLFFQCIAALLNPAHRGGERIKWWLVSYTAVIFSSTTVLNAMQLNIQSICYIDNREFPGVEDVLPPGPLGYLSSIFSDALTTVPDFMFLFNGWLADGLMVSSLSDAAFTRPSVLTRALTALSLLHYLRQEYLGYRISLPHVPWLFGYAFELFTEQRRHPELTP